MTFSQNWVVSATKNRLDFTQNIFSLLKPVCIELYLCVHLYCLLVPDVLTLHEIKISKVPTLNYRDNKQPKRGGGYFKKIIIRVFEINTRVFL